MRYLVLGGLCLSNMVPTCPNTPAGVRDTRLLIATNNTGKLREFGLLLNDVPFTLVSLTDVGINADVPETGSTFEENAVLKATAYARMSGLRTLSDDSGLEVEALGGEPGVHSSRYAGEGVTDTERIALLLRKLNNIDVSTEQWEARFRCVIAIATSDRSVQLHTGECYGKIIKTPRGRHGFGYDPIFLLPTLGRTMAELSTEEKNRVSHRSIAVRRAAKTLKRCVARTPGGHRK